MGILYIVATPIGNLKDITLRALETLKNVDVIFAEDTRVTKKLLTHYDIRKPVFSYHKYSPDAVGKRVAEFLLQGKSVALVTDAGTPAISDPGARLVAYVRENVPDAKIVPIPGPSALIAALSVAGVSADQFTFLGYPPHKKGREKFFMQLKEVSVWPAVVYESPHRLQKTFAQLKKVFSPGKEIIITRELTKIYEELWTGTAYEATNYFIGEHARGEFVIIIPE